MTPSDDSRPAPEADLVTLLEEHRLRLLAVVRRRLDPALARRLDADDILADAFLLARSKWVAFSQSGMTPYAWLYRIVLDCLIEAWRRHSRGPRDVGREMPWPADSSLQLGLGLVDTGTSPSEAAVRADLQQRMRQTLALLKEADREILWMRHYDQLSVPEAAAVLSITENAAKLRYLHALERLRTHWQQLHPEAAG